MRQIEILLFTQQTCNDCQIVIPNVYAAANDYADISSFTEIDARANGNAELVAAFNISRTPALGIRVDGTAVAAKWEGPTNINAALTNGGEFDRIMQELNFVPADGGNSPSTGNGDTPPTLPPVLPPAPAPISPGLVLAGLIAAYFAFVK